VDHLTEGAKLDLDGRSIWVAGHRGMVGSAIVRRLERERSRTLTVEKSDLDLLDQRAVAAYMQRARPEVVILAAARVGGIGANQSFPADFLYENLVIETNVIEAARRAEVRKLLFLGSSCIYPRNAPQPMREDALLTGPLEPTNEWYALAKIAGIKLCEAYRRQHGCDFISIMPTNLYGPGDNFHPELSHVPAALMRRFHDARRDGRRTVTVWGTGKPLRDFLHVDDLADAAVFMLKHYSGPEHLNVGTGREVAIADFARTMAKVVGFSGEILFDPSRADGMPRKGLDSSKLAALGWTARIGLEEGLATTYDWFCGNQTAMRS
jgi:GDP-L-fucose synthase